MLSDRSQSQKVIYVRFHSYDILEKAKLQQWRTDQWLYGEQISGCRRWGDYKGSTQGSLGLMELFRILVVIIVTEI